MRTEDNVLVLTRGCAGAYACEKKYILQVRLMYFVYHPAHPELTYLLGCFDRTHKQAGVRRVEGPTFVEKPENKYQQ